MTSLQEECALLWTVPTFVGATLGKRGPIGQERLQFIFLHRPSML